MFNSHWAAVMQHYDVPICIHLHNFNLWLLTGVAIWHMFLSYKQVLKQTATLRLYGSFVSIIYLYTIMIVYSYVYVSV